MSELTIRKLRKLTNQAIRDSKEADAKEQARLEALWQNLLSDTASRWLVELPRKCQEEAAQKHYSTLLHPPDLPKDLAQHRHHVYDFNRRIFKEELAKKLAEVIEDDGGDLQVEAEYPGIRVSWEPG